VRPRATTTRRSTSMGKNERIRAAPNGSSAFRVCAVSCAKSSVGNLPAILPATAETIVSSVRSVLSFLAAPSLRALWCCCCYKHADPVVDQFAGRGNRLILDNLGPEESFRKRHPREVVPYPSTSVAG
jgi:hypothetical protein